MKNVERVRRNILRSLCGVGFISLLLWGVSPWVTIGFNMSSSVDGYFFLVLKKQTPEQGELVAFWPPENRFYKNYWFVKYVGGTGGDHVEWKQRDFYINGRYMGRAKEHSLNGLPLFPSEGGIVPENHYFVWTNHPDSFDSRYRDIGWINHENVIGRAIRLF